MPLCALVLAFGRSPLFSEMVALYQLCHLPRYHQLSWFKPPHLPFDITRSRCCCITDVVLCYRPFVAIECRQWQVVGKKEEGFQWGQKFSTTIQLFCALANCLSGGTNCLQVFLTELNLEAANQQQQFLNAQSSSARMVLKSFTFSVTLVRCRND